MKGESMRLAWVGALMGVLVLSATALARWDQPLPRAKQSAGDSAAQALRPAAAGPAESGPAEPGEDGAVAVMAGQTAGPFLVALRVEEAVWGEKLFLCDPNGSPLEAIEPDGQGDAVLGPLAPGSYGLYRGAEEVGSFRLEENASLSRAAGRAWTDGELLHIERFVPGTALLRLRLPGPGYYTLTLFDREGRSRSRDLYVEEGARPGETGDFLRVLEFRGLPPGLYTAVRLGTPLGQVEVRAGESAELELDLTK